MHLGCEQSFSKILLRNSLDIRNEKVFRATKDFRLDGKQYLALIIVV